MTESLVVRLHGRRVGVATAVGQGRLSFAYDAEIVEAAPGRPLLSLSLPVRVEPFSAEECMPFFAGLLPEDRVRTALARRLRLDESDVAGFLGALGWECAGAVALVPEGTSWEEDAGAVQWLTDAELDAVLDELPVKPFADDPARGVRISLAGAQDKLVVVIGDDGRVGLPLGHTPSTHLLKPPSSVVSGRGRPIYPDLVANEVFCLLLADECGIETPAVDVREVGGRPILVVERYDRIRDAGGSVRRVHQEDACQALGLLPQQKYEDDGGPTAVRMVQLLRDRSRVVQVDLPTFIERLLLATLVGNGDAHGKNYSLILDGGPRLAPAYDLVSTSVYPSISPRLAMGVGGQHQVDQVTARHWATFLRECRLDTAEMRRRLARFTETVADLAPGVAARLEDRGLGAGVVNAIVTAIHRRAVPIVRLPEWRVGGSPPAGEGLRVGP